MVTNRIIFFATSVQPNPEEIDYWVDLSDNPYGGSIKYFNGTEWVRLAASGGTPDLSNYYTKIQVNKLLNDKANIGDVDSKVDDEEVKDVIKDIQFNTSNPNGITMVMFKYDGSNKTVSIPVASTSSAGIITSKDFLDFVKQHQLQELHTEMIDTFADIRAKYQKKLIAGLNIEIDQETNVISASGDLAVQWDNITNKPDFKPVATSGDYNDLINKLKPGKDVSISEDNVISIAIDSDSLEQSLATLQSNIDKEAATARAAETKLGNDIATTKAQVDAKLSGAYKVKGSSTFEALPKDNNVVGDVYNITNAFNLGGKHYDAGTNVVWTEEGWDALSGSFDTTAIEGSIQEVADNLAQEILDRTQADTTINNNISSLTNRVKVNEDKLTIVNGNESTTGSIANAIKQAKSYTDTTVTAEQTRAENAEQKLTSDLASEVTRAKGAESANATAIANEVERATGVEETLNSNITQLQTQKVDKVEGKGLSTNDYTTPEKNKLAAIEAEANKYVLPAATASALGGVKIGSNITLADGGTISITKANVTSALGVDPTTTYVKKAGDTMTGTLTSASTTGSIVFKGVENSDITNIYKSGGNLSEGFGMHANADIINGLRFNWYDTFWYIGNIRGSSTESYGFGIVDNNDQIGFRVTTDAVYANKYTSSVSTGNAPISVKSTTMCPNLNADMVDGKNASDFQPSLYKTLKFTTNTSNSKVVWCDLCRIAQGYQNYSILVQISALQSAILCSVVVGYRGVSINILNSIIVSDYQFNQVYPTLRVVNRDNQSWLQCTFQQGITDQNNGNNLMSVNITTSDNKITLVDSLQEDTMEYTNAQIYGYASVSNNFGASMNIGSGEVVDWYGVQWSETSSNPDCTRIGNMEMHRTLPIQSMMKPFAFQTQPVYKDQFVPLKENFTEAMYGHVNNVEAGQVASTVNVMIKIPEFWYVDDYNPGTKTHNLKICPHAKPGWHHHKEAYVSAYEAFNFDNKGRLISMKSVVPTVNFTRTNGRTWARANGFDGEAKWNLYTYEEHRAICHLFLVEYATRNSQKAVNTELTPEGFRQGGLGSGCTTGTATINGAQTWSFIPTGSSDSLGSGSGEVTVTIQQTDSSGSNTSTITRKCNRYRGIENPFGHIWKHTDDVISKYEATYRTWYKSVKPDQFATDKNNSYKPLTSAAVVTGYRTEIRATPTCDFFAEACTNGSETTYWCDYNWDNTDTSEHCLLIGGSSGDGGRAGLFALTSDGGVGHSKADVGSRLTYLPWAE